MWNVTKNEVRNLFTKKIQAVTFEIRDDEGKLYGTLRDEESAHIVAFGLNNGFRPHILGGFADSVVLDIKKAMFVG